jgi:DNA replicative helicase MCM subunit Mcm2 (Cdc46/Mcm family)
MVERYKVTQEELIMEAKCFFNTQRKKLAEIAKKGENLVIIDFMELSEQSPDLAEKIIMKPEETIKILEIALNEGDIIKDAKVRFVNIAKTQQVKIMNIRSRHFGTMIAIKGKIVFKSKIYPKVTNINFECPTCGTIHSVLQTEEKFKEPPRCPCGRRGEFRELDKDILDYFDISLFDFESKEQVNISFDGSFLDGVYSDILLEGNIVNVIAFLKHTGKEKTEGYTFVPMGVELVESGKEIKETEEYLESLRKRGREGATEFERFIGELFKKKGYSVEVTPPSGDFGIDVIAKKDGEKIAIQCKLFSNDTKIDAQSVQKVLGSASSPFDANKAIFITTASGYTNQAIEQMKTSKLPLELWDRNRLILEVDANFNNLDSAWAKLNELEDRKLRGSPISLEEEIQVKDNDENLNNNLTSKRNKIHIVEEILGKLESRHGKLIPVEEVKKECEGKLTSEELEEAFDKLLRGGYFFRPKKDYLQRM